MSKRPAAGRDGDAGPDVKLPTATPVWLHASEDDKCAGVLWGLTAGLASRNVPGSERGVWHAFAQARAPRLAPILQSCLLL